MADEIKLTFDERLKARLDELQGQMRALKREAGGTSHRKIRPHKTVEGMQTDLQNMADQMSDMWRIVKSAIRGIEATNAALNQVRRGLATGIAVGRKAESEDKSPRQSLLQQLLSIFAGPTARRMGVNKGPGGGGGTPGQLAAAAGMALGGPWAVLGALAGIMPTAKDIADLPRSIRDFANWATEASLGWRFPAAVVGANEETGPYARLLRRIEGWKMLGTSSYQETYYKIMNDMRNARAAWEKTVGKIPGHDFLRAGGAGVFLRRNLMEQGVGMPGEGHITYESPYTGESKKLRTPGEVTKEIMKRGETDEEISESARKELRIAMKDLGPYMLKRKGEGIPWLLAPDQKMKELQDDLLEMLVEETQRTGGTHGNS
jgi:hypothetical protein